MTILKHLIATGATIILLSSAAIAQSIPSTALDLAAMPGIPIWNGLATVTPLALNDEKMPIVVVVRIPAGTVAEQAHATSDGNVRFAIVLSGTMYYADGGTVDLAKEVAYPAGSVLAISSGTEHWLSAHDDEVTLLLTAVSPEGLTAPVKAQHGLAK